MNQATTSPIHELSVHGMTCGHCERAVTAAITAIDPAASVQIDRAAHLVRVSHSSASRERIAQAIAAEGYEVQ